MVLPRPVVNAVAGRQAGRHVVVTGAGTGIGKAVGGAALPSLLCHLKRRPFQRRRNH